jgi:hypothetical protein
MKEKQMKKLSLLIALGLALPLASFAQNQQPSSKVTAKVSDTTLLDWTESVTG